MHIAFLCWLLPAFIDTFSVPTDYPTIQAAVDAAGVGDVVEIESGVYEETVSVSSKTSLTLRGKGKAVLRPPIGSAAIAMLSSTDIDIEGLRFEGGGIGISYSSCDQVTVTDCRFEGLQYGLSGYSSISASLLAVTNCVFVDVTNGAAGLNCFDSTTPCRLVVNDNLVLNAVGGFWLTGGTAEVVGNDFRAIEDTAITVRYGDDATGLDPVVSGNRIIRCGYGIQVNDISSGTLRIEDNTIRHAAMTGIWFSDAVRAVLEGNDVRATGTEGISCDDVYESLDVLFNKVRQSGGAGIRVSDSVDATLAGNMVLRTGFDGVEIWGSAVAVTSNVIKRSDRRGLDLNGSGHVVTGNVVKGSGEVDLHEASPGSNTIGADNIFGTGGP